MTQINLKNLCKSYGALDVLKNVDLSIDCGEFVAFVGPSGSGKSTLLRLICGLEDITEGSIEFDGKNVAALSPSERGVAMVFQSYALYPHMTVYENMAFALRQIGRSRTEIRRRVIEAAETLEIGHLLDRKPRQLSGGQRQRVAIGRAIVRDPKVFLFDEPLSNLDAALRAQTRLEIASLNARMRETSMIYVTHDQVEAHDLGRPDLLVARRADHAGRQPAHDLRRSGIGIRGQLHRVAQHQPHARKMGRDAWLQNARRAARAHLSRRGSAGLEGEGEIHRRSRRRTIHPCRNR